ncbi:ArsR/SmtB family transcription factor [Streptomyces xantholiticus]|uniref:ArsR/SmtB family transcription factor n=1 Tax=Streptomyces xantholiticus TaxID=68285 RepID=UPI0016740CC7|nr:winged helix-turn-helix domain-containing protein [Streptomyces xantholiticus]GGW59026.1 transcriptional regulator [Streptomyces xantholiticus]
MVLENRPAGGRLEIAFSAEDVARTRFAVSPLWEVVASVRVLKGADTPGTHRRWLERVRPHLAAAKLDLTPLCALIGAPPAGVPGFLVAPPTTPQPSLEVELAALRSMPHTLLRTTTPAAREGVAALREDPDRGLDRLVETIATYWEVAMAPYWPRILTLVEGDILYRARRLAEGGARRLFDDLDPRVTWESGTLQVMHRCVRGARSLDGRGLLLVPSVFGGQRIFSDVDSPEWQPTLRYPPRGTATLWEARAEPLSDALAGVLGRTRALLLAELSAPASTTDLARRIGLSAGGVSQHLTALRAAGLVSAHRTGRVVLYARTRVGESLVGG